MQQFLYIHPQSFGLFHTANTRDTNGFIGTLRIAQQLVIYLWNSKTKECMAICAELPTSIQAVRATIQQYVTEQERDLSACKAFVVGGIPAAYADVGVPMDKMLVPMLRRLGIAHIDASNFLTSFLYLTVVFNVKTGELIVEPMADTRLITRFMPMLEDKRGPELAALAEQSKQYTLALGCQTFAQSLQDVKRISHARMSIRPDTERFLQVVIADQNGTPFVPHWSLKPTIDHALYLLGAHCGHVIGGDIEADAAAVAQILPNCPINPVSPVAAAGRGFTPLHYACWQLKKRENKFDSCKLKIIIVMLLLFGCRDLPNDKGTYALSYLNKIKDQPFKKACDDFVAFMHEQRFWTLDHNHRACYVKAIRHIYIALINDIMVYEYIAARSRSMDAPIYRDISSAFASYLSVDKFAELFRMQAAQAGAGAEMPPAAAGLRAQARSAFRA